MNDFIKTCYRTASPLGIDFSKRAKKGEIDMLADEYCEALDQMARLQLYSTMTNFNDYCLVQLNEIQRKLDIYCAALAIRLWKPVTTLYNNVMKTYSASDITFSYDDLPSIFFARLTKACKYRAWRRPSVDGKPKLNAQQCIIQVINTHFFELTGGIAKFDKKKANLCTGRLDRTVSTDKDGNEKTLGDTLSDKTSDKTAILGFTLEGLISDFFRRNKYDQALIVMAISFSTSNSPAATNKYLRSLTNEDAICISREYSADLNILSETITKFKKDTASKLSKRIENTLTELRTAMM